MTRQDLAARIDHTILKPEATIADVDRIIDEALKFRFASVCVQPVFVKHVAGRLKGSGVLTCAVVGFPHGANKATVKAVEATAAAKDGAEEIDVVAHLPFLLSRNVAAARDELLEVARAARAARPGAVIKVIVESAVLLKDCNDADGMIADACRAVREGGCDFIKTSTGFHPAGGASIEAVRLMSKHANGLKVKASGGIRDLSAAKAMLEAGADRLGLSASVAIVESI